MMSLQYCLQFLACISSRCSRVSITLLQQVGMVTTTITAILSTISDITIPTFPDNNIQSIQMEIFTSDLVFFKNILLLTCLIIQRIYQNNSPLPSNNSPTTFFFPTMQILIQLSDIIQILSLSSFNLQNQPSLFINYFYICL